MAKLKEKEKALSLRKEGKSIQSIANELHVSKSTVSGWCRDLPLSKEQIAKISAMQQKASVRALLNAAERKRKQRIERTKQAKSAGQRNVGTLSQRDLFMVGLGLYWGEGYKRGSQELGFTNSDPDMILFYIKWLKEIHNVTSDQLILRVSINASHKKRENKVISYWAQLTDIPKSQFTKTSFIKTVSKKIYGNGESHFGTLRVKVRRGTQLRRQILGSIQALSNEVK